MIRGLLLLLLASPLFAGGPKWAYRDNPRLDDEINNIYYDIRANRLTQSSTITISGITASSASIKSLYGTTTNDDACSGCIGEYLESVVLYASRVNGVNAQYVDVTSIQLTPGDWDVTAMGTIISAGSGQTDAQIAITTTSGNSGTGIAADNSAEIIFPSTIALTSHFLSVPNYRKSVSTTTTVYFKYYALFTVNTPQIFGRLSARRVR